MRPSDIAVRLAELREAGAKLRRRPARETLDALARVLEGWRDPSSAWRRALESALPQATGLRAPTVREGLERGLGPWSGDALLGLVESELGKPDALDRGGQWAARGFDATAVLLAGSIPMPTFLSILAPLVLRSPVLAKSASRDPVSAPLLARSIAETDADLGQCVAVLDFPGSDEARMRALLQADCVVATGSDETVAAVGARVAPPRRLVAYGHRLSVAALGEAATRGAALASAAEAVALDVALWDQLGCLSPIVLFVVGGDPAAPDRAAEALAQALSDAEVRWPRGALPAAAAATIARERAEAEMRAAAGRRVAVHASSGSAWTVVREDEAELRPAPLHRFVRVLPVGERAGLVAALRPIARHLAAVGIAGFGGTTAALSRGLADLGASRVCPVGSMQSPPLGWRRDGIGVLLPFARRTDPGPAGG